MYDRLIDDYLNKVTKGMGHKQRDDVRNELRSHILDSADALAAERNTAVNESIVREVLARMGPAEKIAAGYPVKDGGVFRDRFVLIIGGIIALVLILAVLAVLAAAAGACAFLSLAPVQNVGLAGFAIEQKEYNASHAAADRIELDVSTFNGAVEVLPSDGDTVDVKVVMHAPEGRIGEITADANFGGDNESMKVNVDVRRLTSDVVAAGFGNLGGNVYVYVPEESLYDINVRTSNGRVHVGNFSGEALKLQTSNGGITVEGGDYSRIDAKTSNGRIVAKYNATDVVFETSNSGIDLDTTQPAGSLRAITSNGRISVDLPDTAGFSIEASTSNGRIRHAAFPMVLTTEESNRIAGHTAGNYTEAFSVYLRTSNGGIEIV
ncbi:DUF4097 family beta strand repeat-containing protein [Methanocella arvoryzae]|uniref:DUF4097 domain-containing protein n=1 Tax=Methanocella arvoryzae (strain DSM 22066 / NBRC 105507 / MRE50) TaxID=351160 RepID=Q0W4P0_METAR|nr:DUF4097 family beta strand repeat-containing protein [Methanocella arvoryzae]CAJ36653.1 hypothetical protein RCIX1375 [Methanocella arvoryzae MRE50]